jgi:hypothetical protein
VIPVLQHSCDYNSRPLLGGNPADWDCIVSGTEIEECLHKDF